MAPEMFFDRSLTQAQIEAARQFRAWMEAGFTEEGGYNTKYLWAREAGARAAAFPGDARARASLYAELHRQIVHALRQRPSLWKVSVERGADGTYIFRGDPHREVQHVFVIDRHGNCFAGTKEALQGRGLGATVDYSKLKLISSPTTGGGGGGATPAPAPGPAKPAAPTTKPTVKPDIDLASLKLNLRGAGRLAAKNLIFMIVGMVLSRFAEHVAQRLIDDQIARLEPEILDRVTREVERNWWTIQSYKRDSWHVYVVLDVCRDGFYDGDLRDYAWGSPVVSLHRVSASWYPFPEGHTLEFERAGLGIMYEHNFVTTKIPVASLLGR